MPEGEVSLADYVAATVSKTPTWGWTTSAVQIMTAPAPRSDPRKLARYRRTLATLGNYLRPEMTAFYEADRDKHKEECRREEWSDASCYLCASNDRIVVMCATMPVDSVIHNWNDSVMAHKGRDGVMRRLTEIALELRKEGK